VLRTIGDQRSLWESILPAEMVRLPEELARVDGLLDDSRLTLDGASNELLERLVPLVRHASLRPST
jgi:hypothetical protein